MCIASNCPTNVVNVIDILCTDNKENGISAMIRNKRDHLNCVYVCFRALTGVTSPGQLQLQA